MSWINQHQKEWRIALLIVMGVSFLGPWAFDLISVPSQYKCDAPFVRLEGDFCGVPISGIRMLGNIISAILSLLPFFSTLFLILRGDHPRRQVFTIIAWFFAFVGCLFMVEIGFLRHYFWAIWGILLYTGLAVSALILESITTYQNRKIEPILNGAEYEMD